MNPRPHCIGVRAAVAVLFVTVAFAGCQDGPAPWMPPATAGPSDCGDRVVASVEHEVLDNDDVRFVVTVSPPEERIEVLILATVSRVVDGALAIVFERQQAVWTDGQGIGTITMERQDPGKYGAEVLSAKPAGCEATPTPGAPNNPTAEVDSDDLPPPRPRPAPDRPAPEDAPPDQCWLWAYYIAPETRQEDGLMIVGMAVQGENLPPGYGDGYGIWVVSTLTPPPGQGPSYPTDFESEPAEGFVYAGAALGYAEVNAGVYEWAIEDMVIPGTDCLMDPDRMHSFGAFFEYHGEWVQG